MGTNPKRTATGNAIRKFTRTLLATTCLTAASGGAAMANTITYNFLDPTNNALETFPPNGALTVLPAAANPGTTIVNSSQNESITEFELSGLGIGTFALGLTIDTADNAGDVINVFSDSGFSNLIETGSATSASSPNFNAMAIPASGDLFIQTKPINEAANTYTVTVNTQGAPEPSTIATMGLGLAASLVLARKRRKQQS